MAEVRPLWRLCYSCLNLLSSIVIGLREPATDDVQLWRMICLIILANVRALTTKGWVDVNQSDKGSTATGTV